MELECIKSYLPYGVLKKILLIATTRTMDKGVSGDLRELFMSMDLDNSGTISLIEMKVGMNFFC